MTRDAATDGAVDLLGRTTGALLAFAAGDALGWPQERRSSRAALKTPAALNHGFQSWVRRTGGRFYSHDETIKAGEYSDDTQMVLAVGRARLSARDWRACLSQRELPFLTLYDRGAGRSVLRACGQWRRAISPWTGNPSDVKAYFETGANGAAMRVLPHSIWHAASGSVPHLVADAVNDAVLTHGHARALVGAAFYACAAMAALSVKGTLRYGELLEHLLSNQHEWRTPPQVTVDGWLDAHERTSGAFDENWRRAAGETAALLAIAKEGIDQGALVDDRAVLQRLGAFGATRGSGTITAVASLYLASRYAAQPRTGVAVAAHADDADTDTLAAMAGGLLGALNGFSWIPTEWLDVQDASVLRDLGDRLLRHDVRDSWRAFRDKEATALLKRVEGGARTLSIDEQLSAEVLETETLASRGKPVATVWKAKLSDGQTVYLKRFRSKKEDRSKSGATGTERTPAIRSTALATRIPTTSVDLMSAFYLEVLRLEPLRKGADSVSFGAIELVRGSSDNRARTNPITIILHSEHAYRLADLVEKQGITVTRAGDAAEQFWFRCQDPDGNEIEVRESRTTR